MRVQMQRVVSLWISPEILLRESQMVNTVFPVVAPNSAAKISVF